MKSSSSLNRADFFLAIVLGALVLLGTVITWKAYGSPHLGIDDTDISLVYAKHFAGGHGFVYNVGGERVEGFTSMAWVLLASIPHALGWAPTLFLRVLSVIAVSAGWFMLARLVKQVDADALPMMLFLSVCVLVVSPNFVTWTTVSGMETGLWFAIIAACTAMIASPRAWNDGWRKGGLAALLVALPLVRPEGFLLVWVFVALAMADAYRRNPSVRASLRSVLGLAAANLLTIGALTGFRLCYFGYPLPNTFYAKVSSDPLANFDTGLAYLVSFFYLNAYWAVIFALALAAILFMLRDFRRGKWRAFLRGETPDNDREFALMVVCIVLLVGLGIILLVGADHFNQHRFVQPFLPQACAAAALFVATLRRGISPEILEIPYLRVTAGMTLAFLVLSTNTPRWSAQMPREWLIYSLVNDLNLAREQRALGEQLAAGFDFLQAPPSLGVIAAGGIKYTYPGQVFDLMGLNNLAMARGQDKQYVFPGHSAFDAAVFFEQRPDLLEMSLYPEHDISAQPPEPHTFSAQLMKGLFTDEYFLTRYQWVNLQFYDRRGDFSFSLAAYASNDFIKKLQAHPTRVHIAAASQHPRLHK